MDIKKTFTKATLEIVHGQSLESVCYIELGTIDKVSKAESIRSLIADNNPDYVVLLQFREALNPDYSPLTTALNELDKKSN